MARELASSLDLQVGEEAIIASHCESKRISNEVTRAQNLENLIYVLLLVTHNRVVRKCLVDELLGLAHLGLVDLPQLDPFLSLFPIETPNDIGAGPLHAEELLLKIGGLRIEVVDAG